MLYSLPLLLLYLHYSSADITTSFSASHTDVIKLKCDALPYRSLYLDAKCYFVIDTEADPVATSKQCAITLNGANFTQPKDVPAAVWSSLFAEKNDFSSGSKSAGKKKAMCTFENRAFAPAGYETSIARETIGRGITKLEARMAGNMLFRFPDKLGPGQTITVKGAFTANTIGIGINFQTKNLEKWIFYFNVQFNERRVVMNSAAGKWGPEEIKANPFRKGDAFDIRFKLQEDHFQILLNNTNFYNYRYRLPLSDITHLGVNDFNGCYFTHIQLGEKYNPAPYISSIEMPGFPVCGRPSCAANGEMFSSRVHVRDCKTLFVSGIPATHNIWINLYRKNGEIALYFNPRLDLKFVIFNTCKRWPPATGKCGREELVRKMPFQQDVKFEIAITNEARGFQIFINGQYFATYAHRTCSYDISVIETISVGDVAIQI